MTHDICDPCQSCAHCMKHGCIPITEEPPRLLQDETQNYGTKGLSRWFASKLDARRRAREAADLARSLPVIDPSLIASEESPTKMHIKVGQRSDKTFEVTVWHDEVLIETRVASRINFDRGDTLTISFDAEPVQEKTADREAA